MAAAVMAGGARRALEVVLNSEAAKKTQLGAWQKEWGERLLGLTAAHRTQSWRRRPSNHP